MWTLKIIESHPVVVSFIPYGCTSVAGGLKASWWVLLMGVPGGCG